MTTPTRLGDYRIFALRSSHPPGGVSYDALDPLGRMVRLWISRHKPQSLPHHDRFLETYSWNAINDAEFALATSMPRGRTVAEFLDWTRGRQWEASDFFSWLARADTHTIFNADSLDTRERLTRAEPTMIICHLCDQLMEVTKFMDESTCDVRYWSIEHISIFGLVRQLIETLEKGKRLPTDLASLHAYIEKKARRAEVEKIAPEPTLFTRWADKNPSTALTLVVVSTNALASLIQIRYNAVFIVDSLTKAQQTLFHTLVLPWNVVVFAAGTSAFLWRFRSALKRLQQPHLSPKGMEEDTVRIPGFVGIIIVCGWMCGCILFVNALHLFAGPLPGGAILHFVISFCIATALAWTYCMVTLVYIATRVFFLLLSPDCRLPEKRLHRLKKILVGANIMAGGIALVGAAAIIVAGPEAITTDHTDDFRSLLASFIVTGILGFLYSLLVGKKTQLTLEAMEPTRGTLHRP